MAQYIQKSALVAEIERLKADALQKISQCKRSGLERIMHQIGAYNKILSLLNTLEVKEVEEERTNRNPADIASAMQEIEEKARAFTEAHQGESSEEILAQMRGEEPVSEDLEEASKEWLRPQLDKSYANYGESKMMELTHFDGYAMLDAIEFGAQWKEQQFEKNWLESCYSQTEEEMKIEHDLVMSIIENEHRQPTLNDAIKYGMRLKEKETQSTIELAEDHAMLAGMEKMKEQMTAKAVVTTFNVSLPCGVYYKLEAKGCKEGDRLLVIKEDLL